MTKDQLEKLETALGHPLPTHYTTFVTEHLPEYKRIHETLHSLGVFLFSNPWDAEDLDLMIELNLALHESIKKGEALWSNGEKIMPVADDWIVIGTDDAGNYCMIKKDGLDSGVYWWQGCSWEIARHHDSLFAAFEEHRMISRERYGVL